jgi:hypothetical protein
MVVAECMVVTECMGSVVGYVSSPFAAGTIQRLIAPSMVGTERAPYSLPWL